MKPALDAVVYAMPICWAALAEHSMTPLMHPAMIRYRRSAAFFGRRLSIPRLSKNQSIRCTTGVRNTTAIQLRPAR